jgi:phosphoribosylanthranilate isomerase
MTKIKFCGLRTASDAKHAASLGATYGGAILTSSIRQVTPEAAREIFDAAPELKSVGVLSRESTSNILRIAERARLDVLQLHGRFTAEDCAEIRQEFDGQVWFVIGVDEKTAAIPAHWRELADSADALVLDTSVRGQTGGTGRAFNWSSVSQEVSEMSLDIPVVLAGGLTAENVASAIATLHPAVVDISSGVESAPGVKSHERMTAFAREVLSASIV